MTGFIPRNITASPPHGDILLTVVYMKQESIVDANLAIFERLLDFEV
jgi:hypothetical protein